MPPEGGVEFGGIGPRNSPSQLHPRTIELAVEAKSLINNIPRISLLNCTDFPSFPDNDPLRFTVGMSRKPSSALAISKPSSALAPPRVATPPERPKPRSALAPYRVALLRKYISPTSSAPKPSSALAPYRVALLRKYISPTISAPKPSSALASYRVALLRKCISPTSSAPKPSSALAPYRVALLRTYTSPTRSGIYHPARESIIPLRNLSYPALLGTFLHLAGKLTTPL
ncbi:hypothetical protein F511_40385 [Dorcoceras hygrometricum]|uniref:Uncharacterized protein n=1 Tax=Dorcoceras hygrometricum TaxID=472368 RepID=A0A2Z7B4Q4_9LAMI|nr:hypothetical protein F511_40385 [Dorcoceras hygrometricum]